MISESNVLGEGLILPLNIYAATTVDGFFNRDDLGNVVNSPSLPSVYDLLNIFKGLFVHTWKRLDIIEALLESCCDSVSVVSATMGKVNSGNTSESTPQVHNISPQSQVNMAVSAAVPVISVDKTKAVLGQTDHNSCRQMNPVSKSTALAVT